MEDFSQIHEISLGFKERGTITCRNHLEDHVFYFIGIAIFFVNFRGLTEDIFKNKLLW
jgi:hypothetical protein